MAALEHCTDHWEHGLTRLGRSASVAGAQLHEALRAYESVEAGIARATG